MFWKIFKKVPVEFYYILGDFYFTDPPFGKMTLNANILRGNMHEMPEMDNPGYAGVYRKGLPELTNFVLKNVSTDRTGETLIDMMQKQAQRT